MEIKELEKRLKRIFPPENYGWKGAISESAFKAEKIERHGGLSWHSVKAIRDESEVKGWWTCGDAACTLREWTQGYLLNTIDQLGIYESHFVCLPELEGETVLDGTPFSDFSSERRRGEIWEGELYSEIPITRDFVPFSYRPIKDGAYHTLIRLREAPCGIEMDCLGLSIRSGEIREGVTWVYRGEERGSISRLPHSVKPQGRSRNIFDRLEKADSVDEELERYTRMELVQSLGFIEEFGFAKELYEETESKGYESAMERERRLWKGPCGRRERTVRRSSGACGHGGTRCRR